MKVFLSWSRERSKLMALALREWLPRVIQAVDPFVSERDVGAGDFWSASIESELEASKFAIICVTEENVTAPWLNYEAGALAERLKGSTAPWLLRMDPGLLRSSPMSRLMAKQANKDGTREIVQCINKLLPAPLLDDVLLEGFDLRWEALEAKLAAIPDAAVAAPKGDPLELTAEAVRNTRQILDLLLTMKTSVDGATGESWMQFIRDAFTRERTLQTSTIGSSWNPADKK
jgi:hypothetical protein